MKANLHFIEQIPKNRMGAFQFVADWRGHQPEGGAPWAAPPPTISLAVRKIEMRPTE